MADTQEQAQKQAIISHMNADHRDSLTLFLEVYCRASPPTASAARMEDVTLSDMIIIASEIHYRVPFNPPMKSLSEARHRLVDMHKYCLQKLGLSDIAIKEYRPPRVLHTFAFIVVLGICVAFSRRSNFLPGSTLYSIRPAFAEACYEFQPIVLPTLFAAHTLETCYVVLELRRHRVPVMSTLWLAWTLSTFLEGVLALQRFKEVIQEERVKQA
jgi:Protein of unknown function (DUF2470)